MSLRKVLLPHSIYIINTPSPSTSKTTISKLHSCFYKHPIPTKTKNYTNQSLLLIRLKQTDIHRVAEVVVNRRKKKMCNNTTCSASYLPLKNSHHRSSTNKANIHLDAEELHRWPTPSEVVEEVRVMGTIAGPTALTGLLLYSRAMISMLFLGHLGELELAGGSLSIGFSNITGYSILSGLAMGMEPICGQAFGARQWKTLGLTLQRTVLLLLTASLPISLLWLNMGRILLWCGQDREIAGVAQLFTLVSLPDLLFLSLLHPLRIYLRTQSITLPLTYCSALSVLLHVPINFFLVVYLQMGVAGVAIAMVWTNFNLFLLLAGFVFFSGVYKDSWVMPSADCLRGWSALLKLAVPTCASVCLEWWWYELMIVLCGLLANPKAAIASMGILIQTTSLVYVFPSALGLAVSTRVGNELGAGRAGKARIAAAVALAGAAALGLAAAGFTAAVRHRWGRLFTADQEILDLTAAALPIAGVCELGNCPQTAGCGVLRGSARPATGANINLGSFYLVGMPVAVAMGFAAGMGFAGLWLGLVAAQACCAAMMLYVVSTTDWSAQVERAMNLTKANSCISIDNNGDEDINNKAANLEEVLCVSGEELLLLLPASPPPPLPLTTTTTAASGTAAAATL